MKELTTRVLDVTNIAASGFGGVVNTGKRVKTGSLPIYGTDSEDARFVLNCTGFIGTSMAIDIVGVINGVEVILESFTTVTAVVKETVVVPMCPLNVKIVYTATTVTDFDATVDALRF